MAGHVVAEYCGPEQARASGQWQKVKPSLENIQDMATTSTDPSSTNSSTAYLCIFLQEHNIYTLYHSNGSRTAAYFTFSAKTGSSFRSAQPCIPPGSLNRVPASAGVRAGMSHLPGGR